jgi:hypothetical protein
MLSSVAQSVIHSFSLVHVRVAGDLVVWTGVESCVRCRCGAGVVRFASHAWEL